MESGQWLGFRASGGRSPCRRIGRCSQLSVQEPQGSIPRCGLCSCRWRWWARHCAFLPCGGKAVDHASPPSKPQASLARSKRQLPSPFIAKVLADAQHDQIHGAVAVDVERVGACHRRVQARVSLKLNFRPAALGIQVEFRRPCRPPAACPRSRRRCSRRRPHRRRPYIPSRPCRCCRSLRFPFPPRSADHQILCQRRLCEGADAISHECFRIMSSCARRSHARPRSGPVQGRDRCRAEMDAAIEPGDAGLFRGCPEARV
jgi:hypothetical protein